MQEYINYILSMSNIMCLCENDDILFKHINELKKDKKYLQDIRKELLLEYLRGSGSGSAKLLQLVVVALLSNNKEITPSLIENIKKEYINNKNFCKKYLSQEEFQKISASEKFTKESNNPFANWKKYSNILRRLLFSKKDFNKVNKYLKDIATSIISNIKELENYTYDTQGFLGNQGYGRPNPVIMIYNKYFKNHSDAIQLSLYFETNEIYVQIEFGDNIKNSNDKIIKEVICSNNYEEIIFAIINDISYYVSINEEKIIGKKERINKISGDKNMTQPLNQILYGPPGTGKTYNTVVKAMEIINPDLFAFATLENYKEWFKKNPPNGEKVTEKYIDDIFKDLEKYEMECSLFNVRNKEELEEYKNKIENTARYKELTEHNWINTLINNYLKFYNDFLNYGKLKKEFDNLLGSQIEFITFHQSYSYEEFVEGIKPYIPKWGDKEEQDVKYVGKDGIFKKMCQLAAISSDDFETFFSKLKKYLENKSIDLYLEDKKTQITIENAEKSDSIKIIPHTEKATANYVQKSELQNPDAMNGREGYAKAILNLMSAKYVLIIDEINRGNISKIFGELITLIEEDKRENVTGDKNKEYNTITVTLPYSGEPFSVPNNLYIIGTMNTADRSIALLDTALRRRFDFEEMMPQETLINSTLSKELNGYNLSEFLENLNKEISTKLGDDNYKIGHAYLMNLKTENDLERAICNKIFPLLQEYFYNEKSDLQEIVGYCTLSELKNNWINFIDKYVKNYKQS